MTVTDPSNPACDRSLPDLAPNDSTSYMCDSDPLFPPSLACDEDPTQSVTLTNTATVTALQASTQVEDSDSAMVEVVCPEIEFTKTPDNQVIAPGDTAQFTITVTNVGTMTFTSVVVSDVLTPACGMTLVDPLFAPPDDAFQPGESRSYNCSTQPLFGDFTNVAEVTATPAEGSPVTASDSAFVDVVEPIEIEKAPETQQITAGDTAQFQITLTINLSETISIYSVSDPLAPDCDRTSGTLGALQPSGGTVTYSCQEAAVTSSFTNLATVTATSSSGEVQASDNADVEALPPVPTLPAWAVALLTLVLAALGLAKLRQA